MVLRWQDELLFLCSSRFDVYNWRSHRYGLSSLVLCRFGDTDVPRQSHERAVVALAVQVTTDICLDCDGLLILANLNIVANSLNQSVLRRFLADDSNHRSHG